MNILESFVAQISSRLASLRHSDSYTQHLAWPTDIHSHLLAGVDDGVTTNEEALTCLSQFVQWGVQHIVTTPHISRAWYPNQRADLLAGQASLRQLINDYQLPLTIDVAAEYMVDELFLDQLSNGQLLSFGQHKYVLIEVGWDSPPALLDTILFRMLVKGYQPLLAHVERYTFYHNNLKALAKLRDMGCLFQLNWGSLVGQYGSSVKKQAQHVVAKNWIDFVGSDLHSANDLPLFQSFLNSSACRQLKRLPLRNETFIRESQPV